MHYKLAQLQKPQNRHHSVLEPLYLKIKVSKTGRARHRCPAPEIIYKLYAAYIAYLIMKSAARIHIVMEIFLNLPVNALRTT